MTALQRRGVFAERGYRNPAIVEHVRGLAADPLPVTVGTEAVALLDEFLRVGQDR